VQANNAGCFALRFTREIWRDSHEAGLRVRVPGLVMDAEDPFRASHRLGKRHEIENPPVIAMTRAPACSLEVRVDPTSAARLPLRAWVEIWLADGDRGLTPRAAGLFMECGMPAAGCLSFVFPDPRTWTDANVRLGVTGPEWSGGPPRTLEFGQPRHKKEGRKPDLIYARANVELRRSNTELVTGRCSGAASRQVRVLCPQSGAVTWASAGGAFELWTELERPDQPQHLRVETAGAGALEFRIDSGVERFPPPMLALHGKAPAGPWDIRVPSETSRSVFLSFAEPPRDKGAFTIRSIGAGGKDQMDLRLERKGENLYQCTSLPWEVHYVAVYWPQSRDRMTGRLTWHPDPEDAVPKELRKEVTDEPLQVLRIEPLSRSQ